MKEKIFELLREIENLKWSDMKTCRLPNQVFYLNDNEILCGEREYGEARYPYENDGLTIWAYSNGYINAYEGNLTIFRTASLQEETCIDFWGGIKAEEEQWFPVSITGANRQLFEPLNISRYTVFSQRAAYYIADCEKVIFSLRMHVTSEKQINFTVSAINKTEQSVPVYLVSYMEPMLRFSNTDEFWGLMTRYGKRYENGSYRLHTTQWVDNIAVINKNVYADNILNDCATVAKSDFLGVSGRNLTNAESLKKAKFEHGRYSVNTTDMPVAADFAELSLSPEEEACVNYQITITHDSKYADELINHKICFSAIETDIALQEQKENSKLSGLRIQFEDISIPSVNKNLFNRFIKNVQKQVDLCALGKNYVGGMIGVRDVFQQLETALMWNRADARKKIVTALNYIMANGRAPRQFAIPATQDLLPSFDIRQFIDQGLWIINTVYKYIAYTSDYSILEEKCTYYEIVNEKERIYKKSNDVTSVLEHMMRIMRYLLSNIDARTGCLRILYGDWNDAVSGLGQTADDEEFGSGVSVMATLQLYRALEQMGDILVHIGKDSEKAEQFMQCRDEIEKAVQKYAVETDKNGNKHIVHGWGDKEAYYIGSTMDSDGQCRYSAASNSFWCISGIINKDKSMKSAIMQALKHLDSKYGIKTFEPCFPKDMQGVGRIRDITPGTYENSCTYVHATMFAVMALFLLGEPKKAWEQIAKAIPITHDKISKTPFVMPNSYCFNEEYQMDGESMGDWYTGSGATLIRALVEYGLGLKVDLDGVRIELPSYIPSDYVSMKIQVKNCEIELIYRNTHAESRKFFINSVELPPQVNDLSGNAYIYIENSRLNGKLVVEVVD